MNIQATRTTLYILLNNVPEVLFFLECFENISRQSHRLLHFIIFYENMIIVFRSFLPNTVHLVNSIKFNPNLSANVRLLLENTI